MFEELVKLHKQIECRIDKIKSPLEKVQSLWFESVNVTITLIELVNI